MALFRLPAFRGGILEQNIARTAGSVGEALVAGAIFTIPAFLMVEINGVRLWSDLRSHYWEASLILLVGGLIGIFFIVLLRRALCVEAGLPFPESVASYEIVRAGQESGDAPRYIFGAMAFGGLIQILKDPRGLPIIREFTEGFLRFPRSVVRHFNFDKQPIGEVTHFGGIQWSTPSLSPALLGIGYIIGPELSAVNFSGGVLAVDLHSAAAVFRSRSAPAHRQHRPLAGGLHAVVQHRPPHRSRHHAGRRGQNDVGHARLAAQSLKGAFAASTPPHTKNSW